MRRKDKDVTGEELIDEVLDAVAVCRLGMCVDNKPYVVPLNFVHQGTTLFIHCAKSGRKIDVLNSNPNVFIEVTREGAFVPSSTTENICNSGYTFQCLMANGIVEFVQDVEEKKRVLDAVCAKYYGKAGTMPASEVRRTCILKIELTDISVKQAGDWS
ncbi:pyridoxamine 5'-phosphate oxidase family protein [Halodesulfovibrio aestuarii]|uniref:pyridoxamine 5'-phosphate oxidase family protein n=1 Tax=Halodesulfovibrio aestuarii TaxID=126333 RepID=UPI003521C24B